MRGVQFIKNMWHKSAGETFHSTNPATEEVIWTGAHADERTLASAMDAAQKAKVEWRRLPVALRAEHLARLNEVLTEEKENLAQAIAKENGKPLWEARMEVSGTLAKLDTAYHAYLDRTGFFVRPVDEASGQQISLEHRPLGVLAVLGPFNFPLHLPHGHIIPALLAGNTVVFKPSEFTPMVAELYMQCVDKAELPPGVLNLVQGDGRVGQMLCEMDFNGYLFTGSYQTGLKIHQALAPYPEKLLALEMGGNNPLIVWQVEDIEAAAHVACVSAFITSGQRCSCARRIIVKEGLYDAFVEAFTAKAKKLRVGQYDATPEPFMGPLIHGKAVSDTMDYEKFLIANGGQILLGARVREPNFVSPGIVDMSNSSKVYDTECFGPIVTVRKALTVADAIQMANDTQYGLSASVLCDEEQDFHHFYLSLEAGLVNWNMPTSGARGDLPFGGIGHSGNHRASGYYTADLCAYPLASQQSFSLSLPNKPFPGME